MANAAYVTNGTDVWENADTLIVYRQMAFKAGVFSTAVDTQYSIMNISFSSSDGGGDILVFENQTYDGLNWDTRHSENYVSEELQTDNSDGNLDNKFRLFNPDAEDVIVGSTTYEINPSKLYAHILNAGGFTDVTNHLFDAANDDGIDAACVPALVIEERDGELCWVDKGDLISDIDDRFFVSSTYHAEFNWASSLVTDVTLPDPTNMGETLTRDVFLVLNVSEDFGRIGGTTAIQDFSLSIKFNMTSFSSWQMNLRINVEVSETWGLEFPFMNEVYTEVTTVNGQRTTVTITGIRATAHHSVGDNTGDESEGDVILPGFLIGELMVGLAITITLIRRQRQRKERRRSN